METPERLLSSRFFLKSTIFEVNLSRIRLTWRNLQTKAASGSHNTSNKFKVESGSVPVCEIIAVWEARGISPIKNSERRTQEQEETCQGAFTVSYVEREGRHHWRPRDVTFHWPDTSTCHHWVSTIREQISLLNHRPKRLLVYINPNSGKRQAKQIYEQRVAPLFSRASVSTHVILTQQRDHAKDHLASDADLTKYDGVVCVGGDGIFSEVLHGLLTRTQRDAGVDQNSTEQNPAPCTLRVGIIPAGSTDCICYASVGTNDPVTSALHIIVGDSHALDVCSVHHRNKFLRYSVSLLGYGFYGDVLMDSEKKRWMGPVRYSVSGFTTFLAHHCYEGTVYFLPAKDVSGSPRDKTKCRAGCLLCQRDGRPLSDDSGRDKETPNKDHHHGWQMIQGKFLAINAASMSCACPRSPEGMSPAAHLSDGTTDLILVRDCSRLDFLRHLYRHTNTSDQFDMGFVEVHRIRRFCFVPGNDLEPEWKGARPTQFSPSYGCQPTCGRWSCDGELLPQATIEVGVHCGLIQLFARGIEAQEGFQEHSAPSSHTV
ncbi:ceramide kinase-like [Brienomyrus brachyistius]|uniref:ceramide kinase-like n=1 Tax=Brienomyrus brachyistius TaxID=42636 RepID=UPI0020B1814E|nr:ceramide kinase-like [Brienomyrus brachyistius]